MNRIDDINTTLRSLDPADHHIDPTNPRARTDLHAILATDPAPSRQRPSAPSATVAARPLRAARATRRVALVAGMAAAVTAGLVALPPLTGGDQAFATWTAVPSGMSAQQRPDAAADCRQSLESGAGAEYAEDLDNAEPAIAERRGVWTTVVLAGTDGFSAMCITDDSAHLFSKGMIGSIGTLPDDSAPGPRELLATSLGVGSMNSRDISLAAGHAGSDVAKVVYHSRTHGDVAATVSHGHFALWLPGNELQDTSSSGVEVEVTYRDGTTAITRLTL